MKKQFTKVLAAVVLSFSITAVSAIASAPSASAATKDSTRNLTKAKRALVSFEVWIASPAAARVIKKESHGNCKAIGGKGKYRGKWQMNAGFWKTHGGLQFAKTADKATCDQQDQVAYRGWLARGWQPWGLR